MTLLEHRQQWLPSLEGTVLSAPPVSPAWPEIRSMSPVNASDKEQRKERAVFLDLTDV